ncbi:MAG: hypothetical protein HUK22_07495 [Thermoguttaceae bacterium]|nr:hypothetical protein [Thermoguttaceae bacterium]
MPIVKALDFLQKPPVSGLPPVCVLFGEEEFLRTQALATMRSSSLPDADADFSFIRLDGASVRFVDVLREVSTMAMFGSGKRLVLVEGADAFITQNRDALEKYID